MERKCVPCEKKVNALIANTASKFTEDDRDWLEEQDEKTLDKLFPIVNKDGSSGKSKTNVDNNPDATETDETGEDDPDNDTDENVGGTPNTNPSTKSVKGKGMGANTVLTATQILQALSAEDRAAMEYGRKQLKARKDSMINGIIANTEKDLWSIDDLNQMPESTLERIYKSVQKEDQEKLEIADYSFMGAGRTNTNNQQDEEILFVTGQDPDMIKRIDEKEKTKK